VAAAPAAPHPAAAAATPTPPQAQARGASPWELLEGLSAAWASSEVGLHWLLARLWRLVDFYGPALVPAHTRPGSNTSPGSGNNVVVVVTKPLEKYIQFIVI
jgi:hypothetical protein